MKKLFLVAAATLLALTASAGGQTIVRCRTSGGATVDCTAPLGNSYVNWASPGTIGSGTPAAVIATTFTGSGSGLTSVPAASITGSLSGVTIDCASNTCQNIANTALVNSSITVTAGTGLSGGGGVSLGGSVALSVLYGTTAGTAAQGNDVRLPPAPSGAGGTYYDTGSAIARLAAGTANYLYQANGAAAPGWVTSLTGITINCSSNTCSNIANAALLSGIDAAKIGGGGVDNTEFGYLASVTSDIQAQLNGKQTALTLPLSVANGGTNSSSALGNNRAIVSSSGAIIETASACGAGTVLGGGSPPNCTAAASLSTSLTTPVVASTTGLTLDASIGNTIVARINAIPFLTIAATVLTSATKISAGPGTTTGDVVTWPVPAAAMPGWSRTISGGIDSLVVSATRYAVPGQGPASNSDNAVDTIPLARTLQNLSCIALTNAGTATVTVRRYNGSIWSSTGLTCVLTSSPLTCVDTTHTQVMSASDAVGFQVVTNGSYVGTKLQCSVEAVPS